MHCHNDVVRVHPRDLLAESKSIELRYVDGTLREMLPEVCNDRPSIQQGPTTSDRAVQYPDARTRRIREPSGKLERKDGDLAQAG